MSRFRWLPMGIAALAVTTACAPTVNVEQERNALLAVDREWSQTTKDPDEFARYVAEDASFYPQGMPIISGRDAIRKQFAEMTKAPGFTLSWTATKADVSSGGDLGLTTGTYQSTMGGASEKGKYVTAWKKQADGSWKVAEDIFNADEMPKPPPGNHVAVAPNALKWGDAPPGLPAGARVAVISGDPSQPQPYVLRAQMPANYRIPPHWHPTVENITVISGTVAVGMGDKFDDATMEAVPAGGFTLVPADMHHYFMTKSAATIQVHGTGPFAVTYVNPADDPRTKKAN